MAKTRRFKFSIKTKLLFISTTLLIIPWIGTQYIQEMESYLRKQQEDSLLTRTQMLAAVLQGRTNIFATQSATPIPTRSIRHVYVRPIKTPIQLDGYLGDWLDYDERMQLYSSSYAIKGSELTSLQFYHQVGTRKKYLYAVFQIEDDKIVYRNPNDTNISKNDHLIIAFENKNGELKRYIIATIAPGWVNATAINNDPINPQILGAEIRIKGEWQETDKGYNIEIRIPRHMLGSKISFAVADVDNNNSPLVETIIATAGIYTKESLGTIIFPSLEVEALLKRLQLPYTRTWVIDKNYRVIARTGSLKSSGGLPVNDGLQEKDKSLLTGAMSILYRLILTQPTTEFHDELLNASRLNTDEFRIALTGEAAVRWRQTANKDVQILTAAYPVYAGDQVIGAVAIEQTSNSILLVQNRAMEILFNLSGLAFVVATIVLLVFATRLSGRIRRLRDSAEHAITSDGQVVGEIKTTRSSDEIGDLSRSVSDMLQRLSQYNRYLETMASKLSHELRTPIAVVRSSLDNLAPDTDKSDIKRYTDRAREGIERLNNILTRMSEATRLEQTLQTEERVEFKLHDVVNGCVEGYKLAHKDIDFTLSTTSESQQAKIHGTPDLIAQLLDKLVSNAIDFHEKDTSIKIQLNSTDSELELIVKNKGAILPKEMQDNLFGSMVSVRSKKTEQPHLGLGLYIVRLIVEFHNGSVKAQNTETDDGVEFIVRLPKSDI